MLIMVVLATVVFGLVVLMALRAESRRQHRHASRAADGDVPAWLVPGVIDGGACGGGDAGGCDGGGAGCDGGGAS